MISHGLLTPWNIASLKSPKTLFKAPGSQMKSSQGQSPTWIITYSTSSISLFRMPRILIMSSHGHWHIETSHHRQRQSRILRRPEGRLRFLTALRLLEKSLPRNRQSRFFGCPGGRYLFAVPLYTFNHRFIEFTKSHFTHPESRLWFLRVILLLETSLPRLRPSHFFFWPRKKKISSHILSTTSNSLHRLHQSRILRLPEGRLWVLRAICLFETLLRPSRIFWCPGCSKWVRMAFRHLEISLHRLHQSHILRVQ
jgi:hypothetical protein